MITSTDILFLTKLKEKYNMSDDDFKELLDMCNKDVPTKQCPYQGSPKSLNGGILYENDNGTEKVPWWVAHPEYNKIDCNANSSNQSWPWPPIGEATNVEDHIIGEQT